MAREVGFYNRETGTIDWHPVEKLKDIAAHRRNNPVAPMVIQDTIDWMKHPGDGRYYDSRSSFEQVSKAMGLAQQDIPKDFDFNQNTMIRDLSKAEIDSIGADIEQASHKTYYGLRDGAVHLSDEQKEYAKAVNESFEATTGRKPVVK